MNTMPRKKQHQPAQTPPDGPAVIQHDHVRDRAYVYEVGSGKNRSVIRAPVKAYRRASVLQRAKLHGQLIDKAKCVNKDATKAEEFVAERRYAAGKRFTEAWLMSNAGNWAMGADMNRVRCAGIPGSFADHALDEKQFLKETCEALGINDWMILRRVCGENSPVAEVVNDISPSYRFSALARFREALDALLVHIGM